MHLVRAIVIAAIGCGLAACATSRGALPPSGASSQPASPALATRQPERILGRLSLERSQVPQVLRHLVSLGRPSVYYGPGRGSSPLSAHAKSLVRPLAGNPRDLTYYGGEVVRSAVAYDIYVNCLDGSCWGDPGSLSERLGNSTYIHLVDQYMRPTPIDTNGRYTYGGGFSVQYSTSKRLTTQDLLNIVYSVAREQGTGLDRIYHVFMQKDVGLCTRINPSCRIDYCGFHTSARFDDIGLVLYSVEPHPIRGCLNRDLRESIDATLVHEIFETITDPLVNNETLGWYNKNKKPGTMSDYGEIADYCRGFYPIDLGDTGFTEYVQKVWSNDQQACSF